MSRRVRDIGKDLDAWRDTRPGLIKRDERLLSLIKELKSFDKHEGTTSSTQQDTEKQRLLAEIAALRLEVEELKTGSVSRTLGTPLDESQPEPTDLSDVRAQVAYFVDHPEYLRLATTGQLTRLFSTIRDGIDDFIQQYGDDQTYRVPYLHGHWGVNDICEELVKAAKHVHRQPGQAPRILGELLTELKAWVDRDDTEASKSEAHPRSTLPTPEPTPAAALKRPATEPALARPPPAQDIPYPGDTGPTLQDTAQQQRIFSAKQHQLEELRRTQEELAEIEEEVRLGNIAAQETELYSSEDDTAEAQLEAAISKIASQRRKPRL